jgi:hypothetical protein
MGGGGRAWAAAAVLAALGLARRVPNARIKAVLTPVFYRAGEAVTLGLARSPVTREVWNRTVEPYVVDLLECVGHAVTEGLIPGLRSDGIPPDNTPPGEDDQGASNPPFL